MTTPILSAVGVSRVFPGEPPVSALLSVDFSLDAGEKVAVVGPSGAGKSTLLNIIGLLDAPTDGTVLLRGRPVSTLRARDRDQVRSSTIGFVFQESHVLGHRTVSENLEIALTARSVPHRERAGLKGDVLERVGLTHRATALGRLLSGGERQRLALARAVVTRPDVVLADEPTGNLDPANAIRILELLDDQVRDGVAVAVITHDPRVAAWADTVIELSPQGSTPRHEELSQ